MFTLVNVLINVPNCLISMFTQFTSVCMCVCVCVCVCARGVSGKQSQVVQYLNWMKSQTNNRIFKLQQNFVLK